MDQPSYMSQGEKLLIVNADDFGRTVGINQGILAAHRHGLVSSATLMVGFPAAAAAAAALADHPDLGVGLHVALTGGRPLLAPAHVPSLVDVDGRQPATPEGLRNADGREVLAEIEAQLDLFLELTGRWPTHFDSHHHAHRLAVVHEALAVVALRTGLPVRNAGPAVGARLTAAGIRTTDVFIERFFGAEARLATLLDLLHQIGPGVSELMCHPAHIDEALRQDSSYVDERADELAALTDAAAQAAVERLGIRLVSFAVL